MNKKLAAATAIGLVILLLAIGIFAVNYEKPDEETASEKTEEQQEPVKEEKPEQPAVKGVELKSLPKEAYEIQDNTVTDTWGVVLKLDKLPDNLKNAEKYTITVGNETYELNLNKYNSNVFSGQVSSIKHTKEEVATGVINKK